MSVGILRDVWTAANQTPLTNAPWKRIACAAVAVPLVNFGLAYVGCGAVSGLIPVGEIPGQINAAFTLAGGALAGWGVVEAGRATCPGIANFVDRIRAASGDRELAAIKKDIIGKINGLIKQINEDVKLGDQRQPALQNLRDQLIHYRDNTLNGARNRVELEGDALHLGRLQRAYDLITNMKEGLSAPQTTDALRNRLTNQIQDHNNPVDDARLAEVTVLKRQLDLNLRAQVQAEMVDLDAKLAQAGVEPGQHPQQEYTNLRTHFVQLDTDLQAVRTDAELTTAVENITRLRQAKTLIGEIWGQLRAQNKAVDGNALRVRLTDKIPAQGVHAIDDAYLQDLNLLKNQLTLRQTTTDQIKSLQTIKSWQDMLAQLRAVKDMQALISPQIAEKQAQISAKEAEILVKQGQAAAASDVKPWRLNAKSPRQIIQNEIARLRGEVEFLKGQIEGHRHSLARLPYLAQLPQTLTFLRAQPQSPERDQHILDLERIALIQQQIAEERANGNNPQTIAGFEAQIKDDDHLQTESLTKLIERTQVQVDRLPKPVNIGTLAPAVGLLGNFSAVQTALDAVVDVPGLQAQQAAFDAAKAQIPDVVVVAPPAAQPAPPPGDVPVVGPQAVPKERSWTTILGTGVVGAASIVGGAFNAPWTTLVATTVLASAAVDHILFGGKGRKYIKDQLQEWRGTRPDIVHLVDIPADHPLPPAPTPTGFEALGKVAAAEYELGSKPVENTANPVPFKFDQPVAFARGDVHAGAAASLQALVKVKPLMDGLVNAMAKFNLVESSLFGANGAAHVGHSLARNLQEVQRQLAAPDVVDRARLEAKRDILARKVAALKWIAHAFQPDVQIDGHGAEPLTKADLLIQLRALTEGGLDDVPGLDPKAKQAIFKARVQLELNDVLSRANSKQTIGDADLTNLFNAVSGWKTPLEQSYLPQKFPNWPQGALKPSDVQTFTRMLISAVDDATKAVKKYYQAAPYKYRDEALGDDQTVFVVFDAVQPTGTTVKHGKKDYHLVSVVKQTGLADNPQDSTALVREKTSNSWWSCNKRVEAGDQNTQVAYAEAPAKEYRVLFFVRKDKSK